MMARLFDDRYNYLLFVLFSVLSLFLIVIHEPWRDEAQAWLIVRDNDISSIFLSMGYENTPFLWHILLFPFVSLGLPYIFMHLLNFFIMLVAVLVFLKYSPFSRVQKTLFILGYYMLYEYSVIARNYGLTVLFLFLAALFYEKRFTKPFRYLIVLVFLANSNVPSLIISFILVVCFLLEGLRFEKNLSKSFAIPLILTVLGVVFSIVQILPREDSVNGLYGLNTRVSIGIFPKLFAIYNGAFFPIPFFQPNFWNTYLVFHPSVIFILGASGALLFLFSFSFFLDKKFPLLIYLSSSIGLSIVYTIALSSLGKARFHGLLFIVFIFCLWISKYYRPEKSNFHGVVDVLSVEGFQCVLLFIILASHVFAVIPAVYYEYYHDFSAGYDTANFLARNNLVGENVLIAAYPAYMGVSILPYLPESNPSLFFPEIGVFRSYNIWDIGYMNSNITSINQVLDSIDGQLSKGGFNEVVLILVLPPESSKTVFYDRYEQIAVYNDTITRCESYYIYRMKSS